MKRIARMLRDYLDRLEARGLELSEFTAVLRLRPLPSSGRERLHDKLRRLDATQPSPLLAAASLHQARFVLLERDKLAANETAPAFPFGPLVLNFVHEGDVEDTLAELFEHCAETLDGILGHCQDYPGSRHLESCIRQLMAARVEAGYVFRDRDAPRAEILRALELRRRFVDFVGALPRATDSELAHAFDRFRSGRWLGEPPVAGNSIDPADLRLDYGFPLLRPFERAAPHERYWVRRAAALARARSRRITRESRQTDAAAPALRGVHAKHHGLLRATFAVHPDVPLPLQHGVFRRPGARHRGWVRLSNASDRIQSDALPDARGLAIKLEDASDYGQPLDVGLHALEDPAGICQDFVLVSHPTFFVRDVREYAVFRSILDQRDRSVLARRLALFALRRPRQGLIFARSLLRWVEQALSIEYHSMTASALGTEQAVKYCVRPLEVPPSSPLRAASRWLRRRSPNHLRENLSRSLDPNSGAPIKLEFCLIVPEHDPLPVEDPRIDWRKAGARCVPVATIEIEPQDFGSEERAQLAENMVFTPWHTLQEHRPLGSLNRARLEVYRASAEQRRAQNGVTQAGSSATVVTWPRLQTRVRRDSEQAGTKRRRSRRLH